MKKSTIILSIIIVILVIAFGLMTYNRFHWQNLYLKLAEAQAKILQFYEDQGVEMRTMEDGTTHVYIKKDNKVIMDE